MTRSLESLAMRYVRQQEEMNLLHGGEVLRATADAVLDLLPEGPAALFSTSDQGAGLAAACCALREAPSLWRRIHVTHAPEAPAGYRLFVVETVDAGVAWRQALERLYPEAQVLIVDAARIPKLAAA
jgi:hypothetical protein